MKRPERSLESYRDRHLESHRRGADLASRGNQRLGDPGWRSFLSKRWWWWLVLGLLLVFTTMPLIQSYLAPPSNEELEALHAPWGLPSQETLIHRPAYLLDFDKDKQMLRWVMFKVQRGPERKIRGNALDSEIENYLQGSKKVCGKNPDFECAKLVTLSLVSGAHRAAKDVRYYSVIAPQTFNLNRSLMRRLDGEAQSSSKEGLSVWVITGPLYLEEISPIESVPIPSHFFYVMVKKMPNDPPVASAFILPQKGEGKDPAVFERKVSEVEELTGLNLFPNAPWQTSK